MGKKKKYNMLNDGQYMEKYGLQYTPEHTHEDDTDLDGRDEEARRRMVLGHQANNYDMRRAHEMLQDESFRDKLKEEGYKRLDKLAAQNMPSTEVLGLIEKYGKDKGTHNGKGYFDLRDQGASSRAFFKDYTDNFRASLEDGKQDNDPARSPEPDKPTGPSDDYLNAQARVDQHEEDIFSGKYTADLYDMDYRPDGKNSFLNRYKDRIKRAGGFAATTDSRNQELANAAAIVSRGNR